jgi:PhnB protein
MKIIPYLNFHGQCEDAFRFYEKALGGSISGFFRFGTSPMASHVGPDWADKIMHVSMTVGDQTLLGTDVPAQYYKPPQGFAVCLEFTEVDKAESTYAALSEGGQITMPIQETFWAKRYAHFTDRFGASWMINVSKPM